MTTIKPLQIYRIDLETGIIRAHPTPMSEEPEVKALVQRMNRFAIKLGSLYSYFYRKTDGSLVGY